MDPKLRVPDVSRIAVLRANGVGDFVFCLPALEALKATYPQAELVLLGKTWHAHFLRDRPGPLDRVVVLPPCRGVSAPADAADDQTEDFCAELRAQGFDIALQMHGGGRYSNPLVRRLGARVSAGTRTPDAEPLDRWIPYHIFYREVLRWLEVAELVGATSAARAPRLQVTGRDLEESLVVPETRKPIVVLHPGASDSRRHWPAARFAAVGDALAAAGAQVVVNGVPAEREVMDAVAAQMKYPCQSLATRGLSLNGLLGLLSRARLLVSNDSGPLHMAAAVGTPTVSIFWCGNMMTAAPMSSRLHEPHISWRIDCPACGRSCMSDPCTHRDSFVADVPLDTVRESALRMLREPA